MKKPIEPSKPNKPEIKVKTIFKTVAKIATPCTQGISIKELKKYDESYIIKIANVGYGRFKTSKLVICKKESSKPTVKQLEKQRKNVEKYNLAMTQYYTDLERYKKDMMVYLDNISKSEI